MTGTWPRGAQVRAFGGRRLWPASSSKQIHALLAAASLVIRPGHRPPCGDLHLVALRGPVHGYLRGEADPVQQVRRAAQRVADVEQPPDQRRDPGQRPPLVLTPPPGGRAARSRASCAVLSRHTAPLGPSEARAALPPARQRRRHTYGDAAASPVRYDGGRSTSASGWSSAATRSAYPGSQVASSSARMRSSSGRSRRRAAAGRRREERHRQERHRKSATAKSATAKSALARLAAAREPGRTAGRHDAAAAPAR